MTGFGSRPMDISSAMEEKITVPTVGGSTALNANLIGINALDFPKAKKKLEYGFGAENVSLERKLRMLEQANAEMGPVTVTSTYISKVGLKLKNWKWRARQSSGMPSTSENADDLKKRLGDCLNEENLKRVRTEQDDSSDATDPMVEVVV